MMKKLSFTENDVDEGRTIFLRNVPFEISEDRLKELIESKFGETLYVKIVISKLTKLPKGVAFIKFKNSDSVKKVLLAEKEADSYFNENFLNSKRKGNNKETKYLNTWVIPPEIGIQYEGRRIYAYLALNKLEIENIKKEKQNINIKNSEKTKELINIGLILPGMKEAQGLSEYDLKLRERSWKESKIKLNNPNYEINKMRLCIRNLPIKLEANELSNIIFEQITKMPDCLTTKLSKDIILEFDQENLTNTNSECSMKLVINKLKANINFPRKCRSILKKMIKRVKIIRQKADRRSKSKRFAFVNTCSFSISKSLLQALNNNPHIFTPERRPIVEFAIEDKRAVFLQNKRIQKKQKNLSNKNVETEKNINVNKKRKIGRGRRQRVKKLKSDIVS